MVVRLDRVPTFDGIFADPDFAALARELDAYALARVAAGQIIRDSAGRHLADPPRYASLLVITTSSENHDELRDALIRVCELILSLYDSHDPDHVRGAIIEGLVRRRLEPRYAAGLLDDNVRVVLSNGVNYTSSTTIDVAGWDGDLGECHDCKVRAKRVDVMLLSELEQRLPRRHFKIGIVTADSFASAKRRLAENGYRIGRNTTLISVERLWDFAPLQA